MDENRLKAIPIFSQLSDEEAHRLAAFATETSVAEGQILMKEGDYSTELIAIEEGTADVRQGRRDDRLARRRRPDRRDGPARARAPQRRRHRHLADAGDQAHPLGGAPHVRETARADQGDHRRSGSQQGVADPLARLSPAFTGGSDRPSPSPGDLLRWQQIFLIRLGPAESPVCRPGKRGTHLLGRVPRCSVRGATAPARQLTPQATGSIDRTPPWVPACPLPAASPTRTCASPVLRPGGHRDRPETCGVMVRLRASGRSRHPGAPPSPRAR